MMTRICKDVSWDGASFYCERCGRAGFQSEAQARGHLSQCKGRAIQQGKPSYEPVVLPPAPSLVGGGAGAGLGWSGGGGQVVVGGGGQGGQYDLVLVRLDGIQQQVNRLSNEYTHMLQTYNAPTNALSQGIPQWLLIGLLVLAGFWLIQSFSSSGCANTCETKTRSGSNLKDRIAGKMSDKMIDFAFKGLSR